jgi:hypothetical protein
MYVCHLGKVFYHLVEVIFNSFASMFLTLCPNLFNIRTSSHVPREMSHMADLGLMANLKLVDKQGKSLSS